MKLYKILILSMFLTIQVTAQTLFENTISPNTKKQLITARQQSSKSPLLKQSNKLKRLISTNLESIIARGDIQFIYEAPQSNQWSTIYFVHANPEKPLNNLTGDMGILAGGRLYIDNSLSSFPLFLQGLAGFNHHSSWNFMVSIEAGYRYKWKPTIFLDLSAAINRSYYSKNKATDLFFKASIAFGLDSRLIPFL